MAAPAISTLRAAIKEESGLLVQRATAATTTASSTSASTVTTRTATTVSTTGGKRLVAGLGEIVGKEAGVMHEPTALQSHLEIITRQTPPIDSCVDVSHTLAGITQGGGARGIGRTCSPITELLTSTTTTTTKMSRSSLPHQPPTSLLNSNPHPHADPQVNVSLKDIFTTDPNPGTQLGELREVMSNAIQEGLEERLDQIVDGMR